MDIDIYESMTKMLLSEPERSEISAQADRLVNSFAALESINTNDVDVLFTVLDIKNVFRDDAAIKEISKETLLSNAPEQYDGYFQVPKTLE